MRTGSARNALFKGHNRDEYAWFSVGGALPGGTIGSRRAARQIFNACRRGSAEVIVGVPAAAAARIHALFPGLSAHVLETVAKLLPGPGGIGAAEHRGYDSESSWSRSPLTVLNRRAALRNNELDG
jgi:hypothetical protein